MATENWTKKVLESTLKVYEDERETLSKYEFELMWQLHHAANYLKKSGRVKK